MSTIDEILRESNALPSLPAIVMELQRCLDDDNTGTKILAQKISQDQSLAAKTLRLANSPFYNLQCVAGTIQQAIAVLGFASVRTMVTTAAITNAFVARQLPVAFDFEEFWRHSLATGLYAKSLAKAYKVDPDVAFMAGLLHDIGKLVLARAHPEKFMTASTIAKVQARSASRAEKEIFGFDHAEIGARLASQWKFPTSIQEAIGRHEELDTSEEDACLVEIVHVANKVVNVFELAKLEEDDVPAQLTGHLGFSSNFDDGILCQVAKDTKARLDEVCKSLLTA